VATACAWFARPIPAVCFDEIGCVPGPLGSSTPHPHVHVAGGSTIAPAWLQEGGCLLLLQGVHPLSAYNTAAHATSTVCAFVTASCCCCLLLLLLLLLLLQGQGDSRSAVNVCAVHDLNPGAWGASYGAVPAVLWAGQQAQVQVSRCCYCSRKMLLTTNPH
jgi:hypothetical protein